MTTQLKLDFVADISCPWCVVGLLELRQAVLGLGARVAAPLVSTSTPTGVSASTTPSTPTAC